MQLDPDAVGAPVSRETQDRLARFCALVRKWQPRINLVAPSTLDALETRHAADSLQLLSLKPDMTRVVDLGSGGGFPGLVLAIALAEIGGHVDLVESNQKKAAFLRQALQHCEGSGTVHPGRIESVVQSLPRPDTVTARALAPLDGLLELAEPLLVGGAAGLFHKGRDYQSEIAMAHGRWSFDLIEHRSRIEPESVILEIRNLARRTA